MNIYRLALKNISGSAFRSWVVALCALLIASLTLVITLVMRGAETSLRLAIERLGAKKDGVIRGHALRRDGTIRDTVMYSLRAGEWPEVKAQLLYLLDKPRPSKP